MNNYIGEDNCVDTHIGARSVRISCDKNEATLTRIAKPTPTSSVTHAETPCSSQTEPVRRLPTTTITLVPAQQHDDACPDCDGWGW